MHECPDCGQACDCDGEDTWYENYDECTHWEEDPECIGNPDYVDPDDYDDPYEYEEVNEIDGRPPEDYKDGS